MVATVGAQLKGVLQFQPQPTAQGPRIPGRFDQTEQSTPELEDGSFKISHSDRNKGGKWRSMGDLWTPSIINITFTGIPEGEERKVQSTKQINKKPQ